MTRTESDLYWDDLRVGDVALSQGRTVTEADVVAFAGLSGDYNQLHVDEEFARSATVHGRRIAHGLLGLSVASGLFTRTWLGAGIQRHMIAMLAFEWQFQAPIFIGDTISVDVTVRSLKETSDWSRGIAVLERNVRNQESTVVQSGTTTMLLSRRR